MSILRNYLQILPSIFDVSEEFTPSGLSLARTCSRDVPSKRSLALQITGIKRKYFSPEVHLGLELAIQNQLIQSLGCIADRRDARLILSQTLKNEVQN